MGRQSFRLAVCATGLCLAGYATADDKEQPDLAFLEYLGMWDETDEDWLLLDDEAAAEDDDVPETTAESEEAAENTDED